MIRLPVRVKKVSQIVADTMQPKPAPQSEAPVNEFGEVMVDPMEGVMRYASELKSNLKLAVQFADAQIAALDKLETSGDDSAFAEQLPDTSHEEWWDKKIRASEHLKNDMMTFLPLLPQAMDGEMEEGEDEDLDTEMML